MAGTLSVVRIRCSKSLVVLRACLAAQLAIPVGSRTASANYEQADPAEPTPFMGQAPGSAETRIDQARNSAVQRRSAPVGADAAFSHGVPFQVPPGRSGMTPSLGLRYHSGNRKLGNAGVGWTMSMPSITRSHRHGFPKLVSLAGDPLRPNAEPLRYDDSEFEAPSGPIVVASGVPSSTLPPGTRGQLYVPLRESAPIRYEYLPSSDRWIEHRPDGHKAHFGRSPSGTEGARVRTSLGTHTWYLVQESDAFGNTMDYRYHFEGRGPGLQPQPVVSSVRWGANPATGITHQFEALVSLTPASQRRIDIARGEVEVAQLIDTVRIIDLGSGVEVWRYELRFDRSHDSGRDLLAAVVRKAPGEADVTTRFEYSTNDGRADLWASRAPVPLDLGDVFTDRRTVPVFFPPGAFDEARQAAISPAPTKTGAKFIDFDGDGDSDFIQHPAGVGGPSADIRFDFSRIREGGVFYTPVVSGGDYLGVPGTEEVTCLGDLDGDLDVDVLGIGWEQVSLVEWPGGPGVPGTQPGGSTQLPGTFLCEPASSCWMCSSREFWNLCGMVDPPGPFSLEQQLGMLPSADGPAPLSRPGLGDLMPYDLDPALQYGNPEDLELPPFALDGWETLWQQGWEGLQEFSALYGDGFYPPGTLGGGFGGPGGYEGPGGFEGPGPTEGPEPGPGPTEGPEPGPGPTEGPGGPGPSEGPGGPGPGPGPGGELPEGLPNCACVQMCLDLTCELYALNQPLPPAPEYPNNPTFEVPESPEAWVAKNQAQPGGYTGRRAVSFRHWPPGVRQRLTIGWVGNLKAEVNMVSAFDGNLSDVDADGHADYVLFKYQARFEQQQLQPFNTFTPRVWLGDGEHFNSDLAGPYDNGPLVSQFSSSLVEALSPGAPDGCAEDLECLLDALRNPNAFLAGSQCFQDAMSCLASQPLPGPTEHTSMLLDVNADGLPDLIAAQLPELGSGGRACTDGHRVLLNRGYRWENWTNPAQRLVVNERWSSEASVSSRSTAPALSLLNNRQPFCAGPGLTADPPPLPGVPRTALSTTDINADGRVDLVFAYIQLNEFGSPVERTRRVFVNTGSGFEEPTSISQPNTAQRAAQLPFEFAQVILDASGGTKDIMARIEDIDDDGLVDLVWPGVCTSIAPGAPVPPTCYAPEWSRNLGVIPDLLVKIEGESGDYQEIDYVVGSQPSARGTVVDSDQLPMGMNLVSEVRRAASPTADVETIRFRYTNFVRDDTSTETLGFEQVRADFENSYQGSPADTLSWLRVFDVRPTVAGFAGATIPVRHPGKGLVLEQSWSNQGEVQTTRLEPYFEPLGSAVRVRRQVTESSTCLTGQCRTTGVEEHTFDAHGYPRWQITGERSGGLFLNNTQTRTTETSFHHDTSRWLLGRAAEITRRGLAYDINGAASPFAVLDRRVRTYVGPEMRSETRVDAVPTGCPESGDIVTTYDYTATGLLETLLRSHRTISFQYDPAQLHLQRRSVGVTAWVDGSQQGSRTLSETFETDRRSGNTTRHTDPTGSSFEVDYDSVGRPLETRGPSGQVLKRFTYRDAYPSTLDTQVFTAPGRSYVHRDHVDGHGRVFAVTEFDGASFFARSFTRFDAFGLARAAYLPRATGSLADYLPTPGLGASLHYYDGFGRQRTTVDLGGETTHWSYAPQEITTIDPRGLAKVESFDPWGSLIRTSRYGGNNPSSSPLLLTAEYLRDGLGRIVQVYDPDSNVRSVEYDGGGRIRRIELPHDQSVSVPYTELCHDADDQLVESLLASGQSMSTIRDELGRPVAISTQYLGATVDSYLSYDTQNSARGRLSRILDESGTTELGYDAFGRPDAFVYEPSATVLDGLSFLPTHYAADFDYGWVGQVESVAFSAKGPSGPVDLGKLEYTRDSRARAMLVESVDRDGRRVLSANPSFDPQERMRSVELGNGTTGSWEFDPTRQLLSRIDYADSLGSFARVDYPSYDGNKNLLSELRTARGSIGPLSEKTHGYDSLNRLQFSELRRAAGPTTLETFDYTPGGNLMVAGGAAYAYLYPEHTQAASWIDLPNGSVRILDYDLDGRLDLDETYDPVTGDHSIRELSYDGTGCLREVRTEAFGVLNEQRLTTHVCGQGGRRVFRRTENTLTGRVERVIKFGKLAEIRPDEGIFLKRISVNGSILVEDAHSLTSGHRVEPESGYVFNDVRGSVLAKTAFSGPASHVTRETEYDAWGAMLPVSTLTAPRHAFIGHEPDPGDGYYHFSRRVYDPTLRRWLSPDPLMWVLPELDLSSAEQLNLYTYAGNNPVTNTDVSGEYLESVLDGASLAVGLASIASWDDSTSTSQKVWDVLGVGADAVALALPIVPGGASLGIKGARGLDKAADIARGTDRATDVATQAKTADKVADAAKSGKGTAKSAKKSRGCFVAGTLVATEQGLVPIEEIEVGDRVWAWDEETERYALRSVVRVFRTTTDEVVQVSFRDTFVEATPNHPFLVEDKGWTEAKALEPGQLVRTAEGTLAQIELVEFLGVSEPTFNLQVEGLHTYFVGNHPVLVHNNGNCGGEGPVQPGDRGSYGDLKSQKRKHGESEPMDMDHQPSFAAQKRAKEEALGRPLTKEEAAALKRDSPAVASPRDVHRETSPTYAGRNQPGRIAEDAADLEKAAARDKRIFDDAMSRRGKQE